MEMRTESCWSVFANNVVVNLFICYSPYTHHYDDKFLLEYCKDRNIQSYTEMQAWLEHLISEGQSLEGDVAAYQAAELAKQQQQEQQQQQQSAQSSSE
jgi:hypothetical protein